MAWQVRKVMSFHEQMSRPFSLLNDEQRVATGWGLSTAQLVLDSCFLNVFDTWNTMEQWLKRHGHAIVWDAETLNRHH